MERVEELVHAVMSLYGAGLDRIVETLDDDTVRRLADDEVVGNLLVLHDLHPDDVDTRVQRALEQVRPYLGSHAGGVSLSGVDEQGVVHLRLEGSCDGCPSSALTVKSAIEDAILVAAPDVVAVEAEGMVESGPTLLQIEPFSPRAPGDHRRARGSTWTSTCRRAPCGPSRWPARRSSWRTSTARWSPTPTDAPPASPRSPRGGSTATS